jgi:RNA polymerase sigma-54 factor
MQMGYGLWQEQSQRLIMTPELRQAITVLQFSSLELLEYLEGEMAQNPVLESEGTIDWAELARQQREQSGTRHLPASETREEWDQEAGIRQNVSLPEHLRAQLRLLRLTRDEVRVGEYLIGNLDDNGYLACTVSEIAHTLCVTGETVEAALAHVQSLEPTGVGARNLAECLQLQLAERENVPTAIYPLIESHLEEVAQGKITRVATALKVTPADVQRMVDLLKTLDPKPGRCYSMDTPAYIIPDVQVEKVGGDYVVIVNDKSVPRLHINDFYRNMLQQKGEGSAAQEVKETKDYITGKLNGALWLIKSIEQRRQTIFKVMTAIVEFQRGFFDHGISGLKPLTLRQIAEKVDLHESTISRATTGKYAQTPRGVFELKYFFTSGVQTTDGDGASAEFIKSEIRQLIANEDPKKPLSDQKITDLLGTKGIEIARRTVAKYREEDNIPSSSQRKRYDE